ncbi:MAG TPA: hypothetical protein VFV44_00125 [Nitrospiraceae bacterium]|nr:hypothetical protein [Nitrospiraceae bacterium]
MMLDLDMTSILFLLVGAVAASTVIYYVLRVAREWLKRNRPIGDPIHRAVVPDSSLDAHISTQWTDGRLRLDFLLALIKKLEDALEQEVETLRRLGHADPQYGDQARRMVEPNLRRFTFDQHLRDECRMLIPLLQFCARDLAQSQSLNMTQELSALAKIQAAIKLADRG